MGSECAGALVSSSRLDRVTWVSETDVEVSALGAEETVRASELQPTSFREGSQVEFQGRKVVVCSDGKDSDGRVKVKPIRDAFPLRGVAKGGPSEAAEAGESGSSKGGETKAAVTAFLDLSKLDGSFVNTATFTVSGVCESNALLV